jgi:hypothetical protein
MPQLDYYINTTEVCCTCEPIGFLCHVKVMSPSECAIQYNIVGIYYAVCLKVPYLGLFSQNVLNYLK